MTHKWFLKCWFWSMLLFISASICCCCSGVCCKMIKFLRFKNAPRKNVILYKYIRYISIILCQKYEFWFPYILFFGMTKYVISLCNFVWIWFNYMQNLLIRLPNTTNIFYKIFWLFTYWIHNSTYPCFCLFETLIVTRCFILVYDWTCLYLYI